MHCILLREKDRYKGNTPAAKTVTTLVVFVITFAFLVWAATYQPQHIGTGTTNVTTESSNNSHLDIETSSVPYNNLVAYWSFDDKGGKI